MKICVPSTGEYLRLTKDWTFDLYKEDRNQSLYESETNKEYTGYECRLHGPITLPKGVLLKVDRIYIRKGASDFDSITFCIINGYTPKYPGHTISAFGSGNVIRFWAKLKDCNNIEFDFEVYIPKKKPAQHWYHIGRAPNKDWCGWVWTFSKRKIRDDNSIINQIPELEKQDSYYKHIMCIRYCNKQHNNQCNKCQIIYKI